MKKNLIYQSKLILFNLKNKKIFLFLLLILNFNIVSKGVKKENINKKLIKKKEIKDDYKKSMEDNIIDNNINKISKKNKTITNEEIINSNDEFQLKEASKDKSLIKNKNDDYSLETVSSNDEDQKLDVKEDNNEDNQVLTNESKSQEKEDIDDENNYKDQLQPNPLKSEKNKNSKKKSSTIKLISIILVSVVLLIVGIIIWIIKNNNDNIDDNDNHNNHDMIDKTNNVLKIFIKKKVWNKIWNNISFLKKKIFSNINQKENFNEEMFQKIFIQWTKNSNAFLINTSILTIDLIKKFNFTNIDNDKLKEAVKILYYQMYLCKNEDHFKTMIKKNF